MSKSRDAFRTISEVADWLGIQAHVLRFWESKFTQVKPVKRAGGRRYYRPADMLLIGGIKTLLHDEGLTIKGVQKILRDQGVAHVSSLSQPLDEQGFAADAAAADGADTIVSFARATETTAPPVSKPNDTAQLDLMSLAEEFVPPVAPDETAETPTLAEDNSVETSPPAPEEPVLVIPHVDIADPPAESEISVSPGPLSALARNVRLSATTYAELTEIAERLSAFQSRLARVASD